LRPLLASTLGELLPLSGCPGWSLLRRARTSFDQPRRPRGAPPWPRRPGRPERRRSRLHNAGARTGCGRSFRSDARRVRAPRAPPPGWAARRARARLTRGGRWPPRHRLDRFHSGRDVVGHRRRRAIRCRARAPPRAPRGGEDRSLRNGARRVPGAGAGRGPRRWPRRGRSRADRRGRPGCRRDCRAVRHRGRAGRPSRRRRRGQRRARPA
jgi:hypothetical protein